jgi:L-ascorbate metabolism protein UlaG (beta-lactamase superfamily)
VPIGDGQPESKVELKRRAALVAAGAKSSAARYPRYLADVLRGRSAGAHVQSDLQAQWGQVLGKEGLQGAAWLGHNTVLIAVDGVTVLLDPVLGDRIGVRIPGLTVGPARLVPRALGAESLPPVDVILISHAHFDHLDVPTLKALAKRETEVITAAETADLIPRGFGSVRELDWGKSARVKGLEITALRPNHWGARTMWDRHRGYNGYLVESAAARWVYAGDTALTRNFHGLGELDLGIFGIGAYNPWIHAHANPEQVWEMARESGSERLLPVHHSTFRLSDEPIHEPLERLTAAAGKEQDRIVKPTLGEILRLG